MDNPDHVHDDRAIAEAKPTFNGRTYDFELQRVGVGPDYRVRLHAIYTEGERRLDQLPIFDTWEEARVYILNVWNTGYCEPARVRMATDAHLREILADAGVTAPVPPVSTLTALAGIAPNSATTTHWALTPEFDAETLAYAFSSSHDTFLPVLTLGHAQQQVFWKVGTSVHSGVNPQITLVSGDNVVKITVIAEDGAHARTYTLTVTRS